MRRWLWDGVSQLLIPVDPLLDDRCPVLRKRVEERGRLPGDEDKSPVDLLHKALLHRAVEEHEQRGKIALDIEQPAGLLVQTELRPGHDLKELLERAHAAG